MSERGGGGKGECVLYFYLMWVSVGVEINEWRGIG